MAASAVVDDLRTDAAKRAPRGLKGLWLSFVGPYGLEVLLGPALAAGNAGATGAQAGVTPPRFPDWLGVDLQHGELELRDLAGILRVAERVGLPVLARMPSHDAADLGRALDAGADGVIVPTVESGEQAAALVRAVRLPPHGARSSGAARAQLGPTSGSHPLLLPMVETRAGLEAAAAIAGTEGVDGLFVGPYDLSVSLGRTPTDPEVLDAIGRAVAVARDTGKVAGLFAGLPELVALAPTLDLIAVDSDITALRRGLELLLTEADATG